MAENPTPQPESRGRRLFGWLDERAGLLTLWRTILARPVPRTNWLYTLGSASMILGALQGITGMLLTIYYIPSPDHAYDSIQYIMTEVTFGWLIRGIHHWGATLLVIVVFLHMLRTYFLGAYKFPRELTWLTGAVLLLGVLVMGFSGYLLPWNQKAYWASSVGTAVIGAPPVIGPLLLRIVRGGGEIGAVTLARFYGLHIWWAPAALVALVFVHLYLIIRIGITAPPQRDE
ncbi:MAG: cytochrome b6 [Chloroflexi bacterium]|nr:cytochrome b6 [Chloroflexota bacterium]